MHMLETTEWTLRDLATCTSHHAVVHCADRCEHKWSLSCEHSLHDVRWPRSCCPQRRTHTSHLVRAHFCQHCQKQCHHKTPLSKTDTTAGAAAGPALPWAALTVMAASIRVRCWQTDRQTCRQPACSAHRHPACSLSPHQAHTQAPAVNAAGPCISHDTHTGPICCTG